MLKIHFEYSNSERGYNFDLEWCFEHSNPEMGYSDERVWQIIGLKVEPFVIG